MIIGWVTPMRAHMTCHRDWFITYENLPPNKIEVILGNDHVLPVIGIGSIPVVLKNEMRFVLQRVLHVPDLRRNLFSLSEFAKKNCRVILEDSKAHIFGGDDRSVLLSTGVLIEKGLYQMDFSTDESVQLNATAIKSIDTWHQRLGHKNMSTV